MVSWRLRFVFFVCLSTLSRLAFYAREPRNSGSSAKILFGRSRGSLRPFFEAKKPENQPVVIDEADAKVIA